MEKVFPKSVSQNRFSYNGRFITSTVMVNDVAMTISTFVEDVIEDCRDLDTDQLYATMYGALRKVMADVEQLQSANVVLQSTINALQTSVINRIIA